jgi:hypothetical protein
MPGILIAFSFREFALDLGPMRIGPRSNFTSDVQVVLIY